MGLDIFRVLNEDSRVDDRGEGLGGEGTAMIKSELAHSGCIANTGRLTFDAVAKLQGWS